jgi:copper resistance protein C
MRTLFMSSMAVSLLAAGSMAHAHAFLLKSQPGVGAAVTLVKTVRLEFSESVEVGFSGVEVADATGKTIKAGTLHHAGDDRKVLLADLPQLPAGAYRVTWHVVSVDTHRTEGDFGFTVKP